MGSGKVTITSRQAVYWQLSPTEMMATWSYLPPDIHRFQTSCILTVVSHRDDGYMVLPPDIHCFQTSCILTVVIPPRWWLHGLTYPLTYIASRQAVYWKGSHLEVPPSLPLSCLPLRRRLLSLIPWHTLLPDKYYKWSTLGLFWGLGRLETNIYSAILDWSCYCIHWTSFSFHRKINKRLSNSITWLLINWLNHYLLASCFS